MDTEIAPDQLNSQQEPQKGGRKFLRKSAVMLAVLVLVASPVVYLMMRDKDNYTPDVEAASSPTARVTMRSDGFVPATLVVKSGTEITWVNEDLAPHQVAANPYPDHTELPELFSEDPTDPGETYTFKATKTGTFQYHDNLNPEINATITVE
jgi:plastocyanin